MSNDMIHVEPFAIEIGDDPLEDLGHRLRSTRWPSAIDADSWDDGTSLNFLKQLVDHWQARFDWRAVEARLNTLPQFTAKLDDLNIHFVHQKGVGPSPLPLIITHGWPGSFFEMEKILPLLTDPGAHGGNPADAFHVVVPSLPGYGFSQAPVSLGCGTYEIAALWVQLMESLGYARFGAQGGDIGAGVSSWMAYRFPEHVAGLHLNFIPGSYRPPLGKAEPPISEQEQTYLDAAAEWASHEGGYAHMHGTKPQTLAYALTDSPVALAAWIVEKFRSWSDCAGDVTSIFSLETLLTEISLYWFSGALESSLRLYKETRQRPMHFTAGQRILPPVAVVHFAKELPTPPRSWVERTYNVTRWTDNEQGGHFAAMEQPQVLAADIRAHFRNLRGGSA
jgi:pimeloyl-ACP methyl ester carboxylesterase